MFVLVCFLALTQLPGPPGARVDLGGEATLFIPEGYRPAGQTIDIVLHLHGAPSVVEPALVKTGWRAVLVEFNRKGLSSVYATPFADPALFPRLLDATLVAMKDEKLADEPKVGRVVLSAFSAGFGGVREILKRPEHVARIDAIVLADSLYCGYAGAPEGRKVDPALMAGFRRFARDAAEGRKAMLVSHSAQVPGGYASTTETADDLISSVGGAPSPFEAEWGDGLVPTRRFARGDLLVVGFAGAEPEDHMRHLRGIASLWKALPGSIRP